MRAGMNTGPGRLEILAAVVTIAGLVLCARGGWRLVRTIRARFTYGAPYRRGMVQDRLLTLLMEIPILLAGAALGFMALGQAAFQPEGVTVRVGQIEARRSGWGRMSVRLVPDPFYPGRRILEGEISGARWAIAGDFISWSRGVQWLGFEDGQRVRYLIGTPDTTGTSPPDRGETTVIDALPGAAFRLVAMAPFIPFLRVTQESSGWLPLAEHQVITLYAIGPGYVAEVASEGTRGPAPHP
jgi:hypothetical protein